MALDAVFTWTCFSVKDVPSERLNGYMDRNELQSFMTSGERAVVRLSRARAHREHEAQAGWHLENMWPLAWVLGFEEPPAFDGAFIEVRVQRAVMWDFLPGLGATVGDLLARATPRRYAEVNELEDLFYCAHNAVRSAQIGHKTVPRGFHPIANGGVVHERRHALTWCLSPGVPWEKTDLST
jgi:hypothetical protein